MVLGGERGSVQNPIIRYAKEIGWEQLSQDDALRMRGGQEGIILRDVFFKQVQLLNSDFMDNVLAEEVIKKLNFIRPNMTGNEEMLEYLRGRKTVFVPEEKRERDVQLIDFKDISRNVFHVTDEFWFFNNKDRIRPDIVFFINGIPIYIVETKAVHKFEGIAEAFDQIRRYHTQGPELLAVLQVFALSHLIEFYYGPTWNTSSKALLNWRNEVSELHKGDQKFKSLVQTFFDKHRTVELINDYILFAREDDEIKKIVLRPHQMRATRKGFERAKDPEADRGLIWHTQGSGKTYSMIITAKKLLEDKSLENPTILMLVDRNELETQLFNNINAVGFENALIINSKKDLREKLRNDRRGLIISTIHKFDDILPGINDRKNIFVLIDEAHRTTGGKLGNYLQAALPNATLLGYTGTPIDKTAKGEGTFKTFSEFDAKGYLDKYSIAESITDGTTLPLNYSLARNDLLANDELLEKEFLSLKEAEGVSDLDELNRVLDKAVNLRNMLKSPDRMKKVTKYIVNHYKKNVEPLGYKAFIVAVDREACCLYKQELDKILPKKESAVVISHNYQTPELADYYLDDNTEKLIRKAFRKPDENPKILIVTQKLLTGFDAPILYCMYLDKPMRDHTLLQAIARLNRPYDDEQGRKKPCGYILDFIGILNRLKRALAFDSADYEGVVNDIKLLKEDFFKNMKIVEKEYFPIIKRKNRDEAVEALLEAFIDEEKRKGFYQFYRMVSQQFDIISPDADLVAYHDHIDSITNMYKILKNAYEPGVRVDKEFSRKVAELVRKHTAGGRVIQPTREYKINAQTLKKLEESGVSDIEKVFSLARSIYIEIQALINSSPYLMPIGERAQRIVQLFLDQQNSAKEALEELKKIVEEMNEANKEHKEKGIPTEAFTIYWVLKQNKINKPEEKAIEVSKIMDEYKHWKTSREHEKKVRVALYKALSECIAKDKDKAFDIVKQIMKILKEG